MQLIDFFVRTSIVIALFLSASAFAQVELESAYVLQFPVFAIHLDHSIQTEKPNRLLNRPISDYKWGLGYAHFNQHQALMAELKFLPVKEGFRFHSRLITAWLPRKSMQMGRVETEVAYLVDRSQSVVSSVDEEIEDDQAGVAKADDRQIIQEKNPFIDEVESPTELRPSFLVSAKFGAQTHLFDGVDAMDSNRSTASLVFGEVKLEWKAASQGDWDWTLGGSAGAYRRLNSINDWTQVGMRLSHYVYHEYVSIFESDWLNALWDSISISALVGRAWVRAGIGHQSTLEVEGVARTHHPKQSQTVLGASLGYKYRFTPGAWGWLLGARVGYSAGSTLAADSVYSGLFLSYEW